MNSFLIVLLVNLFLYFEHGSRKYFNMWKFKYITDDWRSYKSIYYFLCVYLLFYNLWGIYYLIHYLKII